MSSSAIVRRIGMMQGRLVPSYDDRIQCFPRDDWDEDFRRVAQTGFETLEWVYDHHDAASNPLSTDHGLQTVARLARQLELPVASLCAHCFVEQPLLADRSPGAANSVALFEQIVSRAIRLGVHRIVLPIEDTENRLASEPAARNGLVDVLRRLGDTAAPHRVTIAVEAGLAPHDLAELLRPLPVATFGINYDTGNSAGLGYDPVEEFAAYGGRIVSVHIKDKKRNGGTVALGSGDAPFALIAGLLNQYEFRGDIVLEVARCAPGQELDYARRNRRFVESQFSSNRQAHSYPELHHGESV